MVAVPTPGAERIRVLVADSNRIHTQLLGEALQRDPRLQVVDFSQGSAEVLAKAVAQSADILVISASLDNDPSRGFEVLRQLRASHPHIRAVMLLDSLQRETILEAFRAGARGIFSRSDSVDALCKCVCCVFEGQVWANSEQMTYAVEAIASAPVVRATDANGFNLLSDRELEVVRSLSEGLTNREIAERMGLSQHTIKNYLFRIFEKLGVSSRIELLFMTLSQAGAPAPARANHKTKPIPASAEAAALAIYKEGADQGYPGAHAQLARKFRDGLGVPKDPVSAYMWFLICEESSLKLKDEISSEKKALAVQLDPQQVAQAQTKAAEYFRKFGKLASHQVAGHVARAVACAVCFAMAAMSMLA
jgi:DNA-binding NarL/FixJ family response regulator